jgi:energy-coupling factor transport system ATP-binding protein
VTSNGFADADDHRNAFFESGTAAPMIEVRNISFSYPGENDAPQLILDDVSLQIGAGESIAVMGRNGSGKTTFARCLNGLLLPSSGQVLVDGLCTADPAQLASIRRRVGMVFQNPDNQIVSATVEREIAFGLENLGTDFEQMHKIVDAMLKKFNLTAYRQRPPHHLSGGEKQRLALAAVMAMNPRYLVLDEPTSLLDPKSRRDVLESVQSLHHSPQSEEAITTMLITQFPEEALHADRLIIFHLGRILMDGEPAVIFSHGGLTQFGLESPMKFRIADLLKKYKER